MKTIIDPETLLAEAVETLRREIPEHLEWLPWGTLPSLRFRDGVEVDGRIPRALLVSAAEGGAPEPDVELEARAALFEPDDAVAFGRWILRAWIDYDTAEIGLTAAREAELRGLAERAADLARRFGRGGTDPEERYRELVAQERSRPESSALPHQGLLAVVAACGDASLGPEVEKYLAVYGENRPARCQALRRMLSRLAD